MQVSQVSCCLLTSHQGTCGHCYYCRLSLSSLEGCGTSMALGDGVFKAGCWNPVLITVAACSYSWGLVGSSLVAPHLKRVRSKGKLSLAVTFQCLLDRAHDLGTAFALRHGLWALLLLVHTDSGWLWRWIAVPLQRLQNEKQIKSKPNTPVGVLKGFWVWDNDPQLVRWQGKCRDTGLSQNPVSHPRLCTWVGYMWDGEGAPKRMTWSLLKNKQKPHCLLCTLTVLLSHMDFALITELTKICLQSEGFFCFLNKIIYVTFWSVFFLLCYFLHQITYF